MTLPEKLTDGTYPAYAWPGGYPILYFDRDNEILCGKCAAEMEKDNETPRFHPVGFGVFYEGSPEFCSCCNAQIESAYGDPEQDN